MNDKIPSATIEAFARSIYKEASNYGFGQVDVIRLVNELMDCCADTAPTQSPGAQSQSTFELPDSDCSSLPLTGERVIIRDFDRASDMALFNEWLHDKYGRFFVLSCSTARSTAIDDLVDQPGTHIGIVCDVDRKPIGALAFLDVNQEQGTAELRKLIGDPDARGKGLAEEATLLWINYGMQILALEKIYVSTLQTHMANIRLNERIGFRVEGLLRNEVVIDGKRHDVLRMGICR